MSRNTVKRLAGMSEPPRYERQRPVSLVDPFVDEIAAMLDRDPKVPATVVIDHLRRWRRGRDHDPQRASGQGAPVVPEPANGTETHPRRV